MKLMECFCKGRPTGQIEDEEKECIDYGKKNDRMIWLNKVYVKENLE